jgi:hypothetical protein
MYGEPSHGPPLEWSWVEAQLAGAGTYWVVAAGGGHPHPRPVWGVWLDEVLHLSIGSPVLARLLRGDPSVTVHLDSGVDAVVVEGTVGGPVDHPEVVAAYDAKYDWTYDVDEYGPLTSVVPSTVLAWRSAGWAGRDGFRATGRWRFGPGSSGV